MSKKNYRESQNERDLTLNRITDAVVSVDNEWRYTFLNDAALEAHTLGREGTLGKVLWEVHPKLVGTTFWNTYHEAMASGTIMAFESYYEAMKKWFSVKVYPSDTGLTIFYQDIDESKKARIQLIKSEEKYRTLFYKSPLPIWLYDFESFRFIDVNDAAVKHYGYTRDEFLSMTIKDIRPQEDIPALLEDIAEVQKDSDSSRHGNWRHLKKNGALLTVEATAHSFSHDGRAVRVVIVNDITQKTIMEQRLLENQMKLTKTQALGHFGNWDIDLEKNLHTWSDELYTIFGLHKLKTEPSSALFLSLIHAEDKTMAQDLLNQAMRDFKEARMDFRFASAAGVKKYGHIEWRLEYGADKNPIRLLGILQDITERKEAEATAQKLEGQIKEQKIQEQKKISKAIIKAQEQQKNHIAQELHDNINQILFGVRFHLGVAGHENKTLQELLRPPVEQIGKAMEEIRALCQSLATPMADVDLQEIITELIQKIGRSTDTPLSIKLSYAIPFEFPYDLKLNIYRIVQEQLQNIVKHAMAKNVNIALAASKDSICITVEDDGKGYDIKQKRTGLGISNILHRVEAFNGKVEIQSKAGEGCKTAVTIPFGPPAGDATVNRNS
ncbi:PAS domain S-box protein [Flavobacterium qiangtangense]|uniref:Oxygen sensor histidine kinase NreB n=1 Tax=Flavobacterium qiangtangense TaxID=1442595 RepID=A0ABW1PJV9_9FLAO